MWNAGYVIVILTSRTKTPEKERDTLAWLDTNALPHDQFIMWEGPSVCEYDEFKANEIVKINEKFEVVLAIDDHEAHCNAYQAAQVPFLHAHPDSIR